MQDGKVKISKTNAYRASKVIKELRGHLKEFHGFYSSYDPLFDWWCAAQWRTADAALDAYLPLVEDKLAGLRSDGTGDIIGEPITRRGYVGGYLVPCVFLTFSFVSFITACDDRGR